MDKKPLIDKATKMLDKLGYTLAFTLPKRGVDLIVFEKGKPNTAIFVAVMDGDKVRSIPMQGLGKSKKALARAAALRRGADLWILETGWKGSYRFDAVWVATKTAPAGISHNVNINI